MAYILDIVPGRILAVRKTVKAFCDFDAPAATPLCVYVLTKAANRVENSQLNEAGRNGYHSAP